MSTKIYNGCQFNTTDLTLIFKRLKGLQKEAEAIQVRHITKILSGWAVRKLDAITVGLAPPLDQSTRSFFGSLKSEMSTEMHKSKHSTSNNWPYDMDFEVSVLPLRGKVLGIPYFRIEGHKKLWESLNWVKEYGYWNNTDRPDNVTAPEWTQRRRDWDKVLPDDNPTPAENGYSFTVANQTNPQLALYKIQDIDYRMIVSKEARAKEQAETFVMNQWCKDNKTEWEKSTSAMFRYLREDEGSAKVKAKAAEYLLLLPDRYELDFKEPKKEST